MTELNKQEKRETIAAVVVTYNRKELLIECLDALINQTYLLDAIYIIDNASTDCTPELLVEKGYINEALSPDNEPIEDIKTLKLPEFDKTIDVHYVRMHENTGGAGGFHEGVKRGYEAGYDWLWLMDDDAEPIKDSLEKIVTFTEKEGISALANWPIDKNNKVLCQHRGYFNFKDVFKIIIPIKAIGEKLDCVEIDIASFVGILISRKAIKKIGYPRKDFFIHMDDVEFCIRLRGVGKILLIPDSIIIHKEEVKKRLHKRLLLGRQYFFQPYSKLWLTYYGKRNIIWLGRKYSSNKIFFYFKMTKFYLRAIISALVIHDHKIKRIKFQTSAYLDGLKGIFDNKKPKKILYDN